MGADNKQYFLALFSSAVDRFHATGLRFDNDQRQYAVDYTPQSCSGCNGRWRGGTTGQSELNGQMVEHDTNPRKAGGESVAGSSQIRPPGFDWLDELIEKIWFVESSRQKDPPDGDGRLAIGPLQIHQCVLDDVNKRYGTNFVREDLRKLKTARIIARLYISMWMERHREEIAARIFNGGPRGWQKKSTDKYWERIQKSEVKNQK